MTTRLFVVNDAPDRDVVPTENAPDGYVPVSRLMAEHAASLLAEIVGVVLLIVGVQMWGLPHWWLIGAGIALSWAVYDIGELRELFAGLRLAHAKARAEEARER